MTFEELEDDKKAFILLRSISEPLIQIMVECEKTKWEKNGTGNLIFNQDQIDEHEREWKNFTQHKQESKIK